MGRNKFGLLENCGEEAGERPGISLGAFDRTIGRAESQWSVRQQTLHSTAHTANAKQRTWSSRGAHCWRRVGERTHSFRAEQHSQEKTFRFLKANNAKATLFDLPLAKATGGTRFESRSNHVRIAFESRTGFSRWLTQCWTLVNRKAKLTSASSKHTRSGKETHFN